MEKQKGYIVLEVGYEYDDEFYSTGNYGETYEAPNKVYLSQEKAIIELKKQTMEKMRGEDLSRYNGNGLEGICKKGMQDQFCKIMNEEFELNAEDWELDIPKTATDEQLEKIIECLELEFFKLVEIELE